MNMGEVEQAARIVAIGAGIIFGALAISSVSWVWFRRQIFAYGGSVLSVTGIVLIGLSIYKTVDVTAAPSGIGIKLAEVEKLIQEQGETQKATQVKLAQLPSDIGPKLAQLDRTVKEQGATQVAQFQRLQDSNKSLVTYANGTSTPMIDYDFKANGPLKDDGKITWVFTTPDVKDPKYLEQLKKQIADDTEKYGDAHPGLVKSYMSLAEAYLAADQKAEAIVAYREGLSHLEKLPK
jgi:hypothetical protein